MRKNILILGHSYATQFLEINNQYTALFDPKKYKVTVAYLVGKADEMIRQRHRAEEIIFFDFSRKKIRGLKWQAIQILKQFCRKTSFDLVICQRYKPTYLMLWVAQQILIPRMIFVMHAVQTMQAWMRRLLIRCLWKPTMLFAGVSNAVRDDLRAHLPFISPQNIVTLYNAIDANSYASQLLSREVARHQWHIAENAFVFGQIGRLSEDKNQLTLMQAFAELTAQFTEIKLLLIGDGDLEIYLKQYANQLGIADKVIFTGFLPQAYRYLCACDVYVLPARREAFGLALLEAMLAKIPLITTSVGGVPEVVGDTATQVPVDDIQQLKTAMEKMLLLSKDCLKKQGEKGYQRLQAYFTWERFSENFWQIFTKFDQKLTHSKDSYTIEENDESGHIH